MGKAKRKNVMIPAESIERVIDDLETRIEMFMATNELFGVAGAIYAYKNAIRELRKVLEDCKSRKPQQRTTGRG